MSDCSTQAMIPKARPKMCGTCCQSGEFRCEQPVLYPLGRNRLIYVDRCLIPELYSLWERGIETGGCCCGHFEVENDAFIQVFPEYVEAMRELGYEEIPPIEVNGHLMGECAFKPKTKFEFRGYNDVKTVLEQRYENLCRVAWEMLDDFRDAQQCVFDGHTDTAIDRIRAACGLYSKKLEALEADI